MMWSVIALSCSTVLSCIFICIVTIVWILPSYLAECSSKADEWPMHAFCVQAVLISSFSKHSRPTFRIWISNRYVNHVVSVVLWEQSTWHDWTCWHCHDTPRSGLPPSTTLMCKVQLWTIWYRGQESMFHWDFSNYSLFAGAGCLWCMHNQYIAFSM